MKNKTFSIFKRLLNTVILLTVYWMNMKEIMQYFNHQNLFSYQQACSLFKLENMFQDYLRNLNRSMIISLGGK